MNKNNTINMNQSANNKKKNHTARNAAILGLGGAAVVGIPAAAAVSFMGSEEVAPTLDKDVDVDYVDAEVEEAVDVEVEQTETTSHSFRGAAQHEEVDPIVEDANEVALDADDEPFDAYIIDDDLAGDLAESHDIEFIENYDDNNEANLIEIEDNNLLGFDDNFEEIDVNFDEDSTLEDIIGEDIPDTVDDASFDADIF